MNEVVGNNQRSAPKHVLAQKELVIMFCKDTTRTERARTTKRDSGPVDSPSVLTFCHTLVLVMMNRKDGSFRLIPVASDRVRSAFGARFAQL